MLWPTTEMLSGTTDFDCCGCIFTRAICLCLVVFSLFVAQLHCALSQGSNSCVDALTVQINPQEFVPSSQFHSVRFQSHIAFSLHWPSHACCTAQEKLSILTLRFENHICIVDIG